jgi:uracil-DNA glycosylase family 4
MLNKRAFLIDQLRARLEFVREIGIDRIEPSTLEDLKTTLEAFGSVAGKQRMPATAPLLDGTPERTPVVRESRTSVYGVDPRVLKPESEVEVRPLSIFEARWDPNISETLDAIRQEIGDCRRCKLCSTRTNIVFGSGNPQARLVFVGEGPGADEDVQGLPFVGRAGQLLTKIIEAINFKREEVYICNVVKCRPPGNRFPEKDEISTCSPFLLRQLDAIRPKVICCLGAAAAQTLLNTKSAIGALRGRFRDYRGARLMVTYHPAYLLRNPEAKRDVWEDMKKVRDCLNSD